MIKLTPYTRYVIIGLLLSDGSLIFATKASKNARLEFKQSLSRFQYVFLGIENII
jgi:acyl CoA:acetate/3-ketoacid CoA transferase alpha subunit